jgi:hypothetical protein
MRIGIRRKDLLPERVDIPEEKADPVLVQAFLWLFPRLTVFGFVNSHASFAAVQNMP